ncbi:MAG: hypothetical protein J2P17_31415 [Mycobacterium sp.]|nr:hypothetical protein [Mycobacterium sp.]
MVRRLRSTLAALVLLLAATVAGVQAAQPAMAASWLYPNPSIAVSSNGDRWVFWQGTNGGLWEAYYNGSWHGPTGISQMGTLGSVPTVAVIGGNPYVVWKGTDGHLWLGYWNSGWHGPYNLGMGTLGTRPSIMADQQGELAVVWRGTDNNLWEAYSTQSPPSGSGWSGPHNLGDGPLGSSPSATGSVAGQYVDAGWTGTAPQRDLWWHQGNGIFKSLGMGPLNSPPSIVDVGMDTYVGFWGGTDYNLWYGQWQYNINTGTSVKAWGKIGLGPLGGAPSAAFDGHAYYVVWKGTNAGLWEGTCNLNGACWSLNQVPGMGPLG